MRYATIGTSWIAAEFIKGARLTPGMEWTAMYSRAEQTARDFMSPLGENVAIYTDLVKMAEDPAIDGVYIASPNSLHCEQSKLFLQHGKHVICEKSVTAKAQHTRELVELAAQKGVVFMEAIMMLHSPQRRILNEAMTRIGRITTAHVDVSQLSSKYPLLQQGLHPNIFNPELAAGGLMDMGVYGVYPVLDWFGKPDKLQFAAGFVSTGADGYGNAQFIYPDKLVTMSYSKLGQARQGSQIMGDEGTIVIGSSSQYTGIRLVRKDGTEEKLFGSVPKMELMGNEARSFYNYSRDMDGYRDEYGYATQLMVNVSEVMEEMRKQAGFAF